LIGYETRLFEPRRLNNDASTPRHRRRHTVTALYEIVPSVRNATSSIRCATARVRSPRPPPPPRSTASEIAFLRMRYKLPNEDQSHLTNARSATPTNSTTSRRAPEDMRFAPPSRLRPIDARRPYLKNFGYRDVIEFGERRKAKPLRLPQRIHPARPHRRKPAGLPALNAARRRRRRPAVSV